MNPNEQIEVRGEWREDGPLQSEFCSLVDEFGELHEDGTRTRHVYACAGFALYWVQCFEQELQTLLLCERKLRREIDSLDAWDKHDSELAKLTCGVLLKEVLKRVGIDDAGKQNLDAALKLRNNLVHHFFWLNAANFVCLEGQEKMVRELAHATNCFWYAAMLAKQVTLILLERMGLSVEEVRTHLANLGREVEAGSVYGLEPEGVEAWLTQAAEGLARSQTPTPPQPLTPPPSASGTPPS